MTETRSFSLTPASEKVRQHTADTQPNRPTVAERPPEAPEKSEEKQQWSQETRSVIDRVMEEREKTLLHRPERKSLDERLEENRRNANVAYKDGRAADIRHIDATGKRIIKAVEGGVGAAAGAVNVVRGAEKAANVGLNDAWDRVSELGNRSVDAMKKAGKTAYEGAKVGIMLMGLPLIGLGYGIDKAAHGFGRIGVEGKRAFSDAKAGIQEISERGGEARRAAVDAFKMIPSSDKQRNLREEFDKKKQTRNSDYLTLIENWSKQNPDNKLPAGWKELFKIKK